MKKISVALIVLALFAFTPAFGQFSWQLYDFGTSPFDHNNNWSPISYPSGIGNYPSPGLLGEGGGKFDLEGFNFAISKGKVHLSLTNSFGLSAYSSAWDRSYDLGDIFFGFDGEKYQYAIDVSENKLFQVESYSNIQNNPGTYYGTDIADQAGGWLITSGTELADIGNSLTFWEDLEENPMPKEGSETYILEYEFDAELVGGFAQFEKVSFHNTLACGNDLIDESYSSIPEPATILLFGLGAIGLGAAYRRKRR